MRKIDKLIFQATLPPAVIALSVLTFLVFLREFGRLAELLISRNASLGVIGTIAVAILPGIVIFSLPMSFLIGILVGLSKLSGESEITALRASGVPLLRLLKPIMAVGGFVWALTSCMTLLVLPAANDTLNDLKDRISLRHAAAQIQPRVFYEGLSSFVFYFDDIALGRQRWSGVFVSDNSNPNAPRIVLARDGSWLVDREAYRLQLHLEKGRIYEVSPDDPSKDNVSVFMATDIPVELSQGPGGSHPANLPRTAKKPFEQSTDELWRGLPNNATAAERRDQLIELNRRLALPFSVVAFAVLGLSLGINTEKGGRASGFVLSFALVLLFYILLLGGIRLASVGNAPPWLGAWGADLILFAVGLAALSTAERGTWLTQWISAWNWKRANQVSTLQPQWHERSSAIASFDRVVASSRTGLTRFRFPKVLDVYVSKGFLLYFLWSILVCTSLFVIITLCELLDDIIRNQIAYSVLVDYFIFLTPQILLLVIPMSVLLAILINFGILEKSSQVTALKAGGWSLYRIAMPIFLISATLCTSLYLLQDYVLPYANIRQDSLRNIIKGRPAQTFMRPQRKWIFGESHRIFNYDYFDPSRNLFVGLNVFEIDLSSQQILRRIHADRAWLREGEPWVLDQGWIRDFRPERQGFQYIKKAEFHFPEKSSYFQKEIFAPKESSKLTYLQLKDYIRYLKKSGFNATELQVELYKKVSFPLSSIVMALVGIPFSFSMGRKGAFLGITISIAIAIGYWGVFGIFEQMGAYGLLVPQLAAWAPNILFGAAGLAMLFTIRT